MSKFNEKKINKEMLEHLDRLQELFKQHGLIFSKITVGGLLGVVEIESTYEVELFKEIIKK